MGIVIGTLPVGDRVVGVHLVYLIDYDTWVVFEITGLFSKFWEFGFDYGEVSLQSWFANWKAYQILFGEKAHQNDTYINKGMEVLLYFSISTLYSNITIHSNSEIVL